MPVGSNTEMKNIKIKNIKIKNMGVNKNNEYWLDLQKNYNDILQTC